MRHTCTHGKAQMAMRDAKWSCHARVAKWHCTLCFYNEECFAPFTLKLQVEHVNRDDGSLRSFQPPSTGARFELGGCRLGPLAQ